MNPIENGPLWMLWSLIDFFSLLGEDNKPEGDLGPTQLASRWGTNFLIKKLFVYFFTKCLAVCAKNLEAEHPWPWYFCCLYPMGETNWHANFRVISIINKNKEGWGVGLLSKVSCKYEDLCSSPRIYIVNNNNNNINKARCGEAYL